MNAILFLVAVLIAFAGGIAAHTLYTTAVQQRKANASLLKEIEDLKLQIKSKQIPYHLADGLENLKALQNGDAFEKARMRRFLMEIVDSLDRSVEYDELETKVYSAMRNGRYDPDKPAKDQ